ECAHVRACLPVAVDYRELAVLLGDRDEATRAVLVVLLVALLLAVLRVSARGLGQELGGAGDAQDAACIGLAGKDRASLWREQLDRGPGHRLAVGDPDHPHQARS